MSKEMTIDVENRVLVAPGLGDTPNDGVEPGPIFMVRLDQIGAIYISGGGFSGDPADVMIRDVHGREYLVKYFENEYDDDGHKVEPYVDQRGLARAYMMEIAALIGWHKIEVKGGGI